MPTDFTEWDLIEKLHTRHAEEFPETQTSVDAIRRIRSILEPHWRIARFNEYPLAYLLCVAPHPMELTHLAKKLELVQRIPGSERRIRRLGSIQDFSSAWQEIDSAFKLRLNGWECQFVEQETTPSPDIVAKKDGHTFEVEVTSVNPPSEDELANTMASTIIVVQTQTRCAIGGIAYISNRLNDAAVRRFGTKLREAAGKAQTEATCVTLNERGVYNFQVASWESAHLMDPRWKGAWMFERTAPLPKDRRLNQKVREKVERQLSGENPGLLIVYDTLMNDNELKRLVELDLSIQVGTYGHLKAVVLLRPRIWTDPFAPERHEKEMQVSGRHSLPDREAESFIIWRNRMEPMSADPIIPAITDFPVNLEKFYAE